MQFLVVLLLLPFVFAFVYWLSFPPQAKSDLYSPKEYRLIETVDHSYEVQARLPPSTAWVTTWSYYSEKDARESLALHRSMEAEARERAAAHDGAAYWVVDDSSE